MLTYDFKSLIRCDYYKGFIMKCKLMMQEDSDPLFQGLLVLPVTEKSKITHVVHPAPFEM